MTTQPTPADRERVQQLLGRTPQGAYEIAVRDGDGNAMVLRNAPLLDDGTPMPTLYWLIDPEQTRTIGRLESQGGVDAAESAVDADELAGAHARYAAIRDALIPADHTGPRPHGGVGGTRTGVKCLHAHWAWHLAGGDDPVGRWIAAQLAGSPVRFDFEPARTTITLPSGERWDVPWGPTNLTRRWLADDDPPHPGDLTNALGTVDDHLDDAERAHPALPEPLRDPQRSPVFSGEAIDALARLELGVDRVAAPLAFDRPNAEEVFRIVATESAADRAHNPGLPSEHVDTIVATCCIVLSVMRRFHLDRVTLHASSAIAEH